jgi:hypothetical protein
VIYQIYPRSFQDSNGDGVGDLAGIIHRLPHVADLGVDAIWISPFFRSPMLDFGYDVSDYRDVDPMFGTLGDFDALIERAHALGLKVLIDLVISHTSELHPWFTESRSSRDNPKADWYVWANAKPDGTPPNNWLSIFGGSAWEWDGERMQYYLHNFLIEQPDLNMHNPDVQNELLDVARFWLDRGVDGFRLDTVNFYFHDQELRDNPPIDEGEWNDKTAPAVNPYNFQNHLYDKNRPENLAFLQRLRALMDEYPAITSVGEVGESQRGAEIQAEYTSGGDKLHMCYDFDFLSNHPPTGSFIASVLDKANRTLSDGWACWAFSNHDVVRHPSRWNLDEAAARLRGRASVGARLGLPLPGRGTGPDRGLCRLRGASGPLRQALLAQVQGPRRLPHADPVDARQPVRRLHRRQALAARRDGASAPRGWRAGAGRRLDAAPLPPDDRLPEGASGAGEGNARHRRGARGSSVVHPRPRGHGTVLRVQPLGRGAGDFAAAGRLAAGQGCALRGDRDGDGITLPPYQAYFGLGARP